MQLSFNREQLFKLRAYPEWYDSKNLSKTAVVLFCILFVFLLLYKPFGVYEPELKYDYVLICAFHALSPSLIVYTYFSGVNYFKSKRGILHQWTLFREYCQLSVVLLLAGVASFLMRDIIYDNAYNWSLRYFWEEIRNCYLVGSLFYLILTNFHFRSDRNIAPGIESDLNTELFITTQVKQDNFIFCPDDLLLAKAEGNYVTLTMCKNGVVTTELKRITLRQLEQQLSPYAFIFRCHRAYLVNMMQIAAVAGNSQGYALSFPQHNDKVPVSRSHLSQFNHLYHHICLSGVSVS